MNTEKNYVAIAQFEGFNKDLSRVLFNEAFKGETVFYYTSEKARESAVIKMRERSRKKGITVQFKYVNRSVSEENNATETVIDQAVSSSNE